MKTLITFGCIVMLTFSLSAQIDSKKQSGAIIPAVESPKDSADSQKVIPKKITPNDQLSGAKSPNIVGKLEFPRKEFSMFPKEEFANPGELYTKKLEKIEKTLLPEGYGETSGLKNDAYWGDYKTKSNKVTVLYRDYSAIDGDLLRVYVNGDIIQPRIYLTGNFSGFELTLKEGVNEIIFQAINTGASGPNTATYKIQDEFGSVITKKVWALEAGVKVSVDIVKE
ncbi:MAG: hypothetical protein ACON5F_07460 [Jejuia sp.]